MSTVTFSTPVCSAGVSGTAVSADLNVQPVLLCYPSLDEVGDWHSLHAGAYSPKHVFLLFPRLVVVSIVLRLLIHSIRLSCPSARYDFRFLDKVLSQHMGYRFVDCWLPQHIYR